MDMDIGIIGGADGPTAIMVAGEELSEMFLSGVIVGGVVGLIAGALVTLGIVGIVYLIKKNKKKQGEI